MKQATLTFLIDRENKKVCLAMKKRGFGMNKWNGYGGKIQEGETIEEAAIRELKEETTDENGNSGIIVKKENLEKVASLHFLFPKDKSDWNQDVTVFFVYDWEGKEAESEEMRPQWYSLDEIPYDDMWSDDRYWLEKVLKGERLEANFSFDDSDQMIGNEIRVV